MQVRSLQLQESHLSVTDVCIICQVFDLLLQRSDGGVFLFDGLPQQLVAVDGLLQQLVAMFQLFEPQSFHSGKFLCAIAGCGLGVSLFNHCTSSLSSFYNLFYTQIFNGKLTITNSQ